MEPRRPPKRAAKISTTRYSLARGRSWAVKWSDEAHKALCGALLEVFEANDISVRANRNILVQSMMDRGQTFSWEGIRQHLQKLKRKETASGGGNSEPSSSKKSTPAKRVRQTADDDEETPTKKGRTSAGGKKKKTPASESVKQEENFEGYAVKHEPTEYDDDGDV